MKTGFLMTTAAALILCTAAAQAGNLGSSVGLSSGTSVQTGSGAGVNVGGVGVNTGIGDNAGAGASASGNSNTEMNSDSTGSNIRTDTGISADTSTSMAIPSNMTSDQFTTFTESQWDTNADGMVSSSEWNNASLWFGEDVDARTRSFATWDSNSNGSLDRNELISVFGTSGLYQRFDVNGNGTIDSTEAARIPR